MRHPTLTACSLLLMLMTVTLACKDLPDSEPPTPVQASATVVDDSPPTPTPRPITPSPSLTPSAALQPSPGSDMQALRKRLQQAIASTSMPGVYAVAVTDLQTGETISVDGDEQRLAGCVMNFFVILQVALDLQAGRYGLDAAEDLVAATTWSSNAATARELYQLAGSGDVKKGVQRVDALIHGMLGLDDVLIDHPPLYQADSIGRDYNNWLTANAMNRALAALWDGDILEPKWRDFVLSNLAKVKPGLNYLTAAVPEGIVSHKNGFFEADTGFVDNDAGIIRLQRDGRELAYAVAFLSQEVPVKYGDVVLGQQVSRLVYDVMAARYP